MEASIERLDALSLLWHYTTWKGLSGIVETEVLWASNYRYLNDEREVTYAFDLFTAAVNQAEPNIKPPYVATPNYDWRVWKPIWVTSASNRCDSLSQWRAYSGGTGGFAVGFTSAVLQRAADQLTTGAFEAKFVECLYEKADHDSVIDPLSAPLIDVRARSRAAEADPASDGLVRYHASKGPYYIERSQLRDLYQRAPELKHESFIDEEEWRIVCHGAFVDAKKQWPPAKAFHSKGRLSVPYIEIPVGTDDGTASIAGILVGPGNKDLNAESVERLLALKHAAVDGTSSWLAIPVAKSQVPYRES